MSRESTRDPLLGISTNIALLIAALAVLSGYSRGQSADTLLINGVVVFAAAQVVLEIGYLVIVAIGRSAKMREVLKAREERSEEE